VSPWANVWVTQKPTGTAAELAESPPRQCSHHLHVLPRAPRLLGLPLPCLPAVPQVAQLPHPLASLRMQLVEPLTNLPVSALPRVSAARNTATAEARKATVVMAVRRASASAVTSCRARLPPPLLRQCQHQLQLRVQPAAHPAAPLPLLRRSLLIAHAVPPPD
jgi:hypothetical protein